MMFPSKLEEGMREKTEQASHMQEPREACCGATEQETCCEPSAKATCCASEVTGKGGCGCH